MASNQTNDENVPPSSAQSNYKGPVYKEGYNQSAPQVTKTGTPSSMLNIKPPTSNFYASGTK